MIRSRKSRRLTAVTAAAVSAGVILAGCASSDGGGSDKASGTWPGAKISECSGLDQLSQYGDLTGKTLEVYTSITPPEGDTQVASYALFEKCTGAKVKYNANKDFEKNVLVRAQGNDLPDIAYVPQPGLLKQLVDTGTVATPPKDVETNVDKWWSKDWKTYGTVDGKFYAAPLGANMKSFVWYSPSMFKQHNWTVPTTWDDMMKLTDTIQKSGITPWCAGFESGDATGWPGTDWVEEVMLRTAGPDVYDKWISHDIPFNDPQVATALDTVGKILKNPKYVNGGLGDVKSINGTAFGDAGLPILKGKCAMMQMAGFYAANWPKGTTVAPDGQVFAFYEPTVDPSKGTPVEGGGEFVASFNKKPATQAFQTYLSTDVWANEKAKATPGGGWLSANKGLDVNNLVSPIDQLSAKTLADPNTVFRFDASDAMPGAVGSGTFWKEMVNWISGQSTKDTLDNIEASWPAS
ncbi:ABC transporter substrate-binding protein [Nocardioides sp. CER19]|uniref:ABC transporter substrate-binding protein n=1 Tax=Nocardioides sp. CER19 TaxID=3038538 RepID=UPI0024488666|nr:ABC transporter substrate-binding protein [Nocardioides sp. CER19]MDH2413503.1 ABC transporter substrate-binding protein [Nocardioides sp. CER19]